MINLEAFRTRNVTSFSLCVDFQITLILLNFGCTIVKNMLNCNMKH